MSMPPKKPVRQANNYLKYSGMAFQMVGTMLFGIFIGRWLDRKLMTPKPYFTALFALIFTGAAIYLVLRDFLAKKE
ncbi:MAG: AtpZ/AtpI family protein [Saprospiraceae bacterium]